MYIPRSRIKDKILLLATFSGCYCINTTWYSYMFDYCCVSQQHATVRITRKITRAENDMALMLTSKLTWLCGWSTWTRFQCRDRNWLGFGRGSKWLGLESGTKVTCFFVGGHGNWIVSRARIEVDLTPVFGSKLNRVLCGGSKLTWF